MCSADARESKRLLRDHAARVQGRGDDAEDASPARCNAAFCGRNADDDRTGEGDRHTHEQRPREALAEEEPGQERDQDRADVDEHRRRAGIHTLLGLVENGVVEPEPEHAARHEQRKLRATRPASSAGERERAEQKASDGEPAQAQRAGRQVLPRGTDADEGRRPEDDRDEGGEEGHVRETNETGRFVSPAIGLFARGERFRPVAPGIGSEPPLWEKGTEALRPRLGPPARLAVSHFRVVTQMSHL